MRSRIRYAAITFLIASVPLVLMLLATRGEQGAQAEPPWQVFAYGVAEWYPWAIVAPFIDRRVRRSRPQSRGDRARAMGGHAVVALGFMFLHGSAIHVVMGMTEPAYIPATLAIDPVGPDS